MRPGTGFGLGEKDEFALVVNGPLQCTLMSSMAEKLFLTVAKNADDNYDDVLASAVESLKDGGKPIVTHVCCMSVMSPSFYDNPPSISIFAICIKKYCLSVSMPLKKSGPADAGRRPSICRPWPAGRVRPSACHASSTQACGPDRRYM